MEHLNTTKLDRRQLLLACAAASLPAACALHPEPSGAASIEPWQFREDAQALRAMIERTHPQPEHSVDPAALGRAIEAKVQTVDRALSIDQAWRVWSELNPLLADGHLFVGYEDWRATSRSFLAGGGRFFPFEVDVASNGQVTVLSQLGGAASPLAGARIVSIDGRDATELSAHFLRHVHGDSLLFRTGLLSRRWWFYQWKLLGPAPLFDTRFASGAAVERMRLPGSPARPVILAEEADFDRHFSVELLPPDAALLTVKTFNWSDKPRFRAFTAAAFATLRSAGVRHLVIDVRENGGGDDDMWIEGILPYIPGRRYRWASTYIKKVVQANPAAGERLGDIVSGEIERWIEPRPDLPDRFAGRVSVLVGRGTYSSAVLFSNVMQDFRFGMVAGVAGAVRTRQSGGVRRVLLPHSGLSVWSPRFVLTRPAGPAAPEWLTPDVVLDDDALRPESMVEIVLRIMRTGAVSR